MAYYDALITKWGTLSGTTAQKLTAINTATVASAQPAILSVNAIINAIASADFLTLTALQLQQMAFLMAGSTSVNASPGTTIRAVFQSVFSGKATTLANLSALVAPFDNATIPWWQSNGYSSPIGSGDLTAAGGLV